MPSGSCTHLQSFRDSTVTILMVFGLKQPHSLPYSQSLNLTPSQPNLQLLQRLPSMRDLILHIHVSITLILIMLETSLQSITDIESLKVETRTYLLNPIHLSIRLPFIFKTRIPTYASQTTLASTLTTPKNHPSFPPLEHAYSPKLLGPRAGTNFPSVLPWNRIGGSPGPAQYPNVQTEVIVLSS